MSFVNCSQLSHSLRICSSRRLSSVLGFERCSRMALVRVSESLCLPLFVFDSGSKGAIWLPNFSRPAPIHATCWVAPGSAPHPPTLSWVCCPPRPDAQGPVIPICHSWYLTTCFTQLYQLHWLLCHQHLCLPPTQTSTQVVNDSAQLDSTSLLMLRISMYSGLGSTLTQDSQSLKLILTHFPRGNFSDSCSFKINHLPFRLHSLKAAFQMIGPKILPVVIFHWFLARLCSIKERSLWLCIFLSYSKKVYWKETISYKYNCSSLKGGEVNNNSWPSSWLLRGFGKIESRNKGNTM